MGMALGQREDNSLVTAYQISNNNRPGPVFINRGRVGSVVPASLCIRANIPHVKGPDEMNREE